MLSSVGSYHKLRSEVSKVQLKNFLTVPAHDEEIVRNLLYPRTTAGDALRKFEANFASIWVGRNDLALHRIRQYIKMFLVDCESVTMSGNLFIMHNVWTKSGGRYLRWEFRRAAVLHHDPAPHADFFFVYQHMMIPPARLTEVLAISGSITYYKLGMEAGAGCHFRGAGVATLSLAKEVADGMTSAADAKAAYGQRIRMLHKEEMNAMIGGTEGTPLIDAYEQYTTSV